MNPLLYAGLYLVGNLGTLVTVGLASNRATQEAAIAIPIFLILIIAVNLTFIYKIWSSIQFDQHARTSAGKAVGFMFIPFFNLYWLFQILPGWATDYNNTVKANQLQVPLANQGLLIGHAVLVLIAIPVVAGFIQAFSIFKACQAVNALNQARGV